VPESIQQLRLRLATSIVPGFRERLLDRGLARGLIWRDGVLPTGAPQFVPSLTADLLDYAHTVLALALRLQVEHPQSEELNRAFVVAGEAIEAAVHRGDALQTDRGFNRVSAAVAFHLARYAARAYSVLPNALDLDNLSPAEIVIVQLLRRSLDGLQEQVTGWLLDETHSDETIAQRLQEDQEFDESDAVNVVITSSIMRGLALFDHSLVVGADELAGEAKRRLFATAEAAKDLHCVSHWWTATLAGHLIDDLWQVSFHKQLSTLPPEDADAEQWNSLRWAYINRLRVGRRSAIELWPSQLEAAQRALDLNDDLVVALPTSAGKTRIAELCILRALASGKRIVYLTPLRALSAQIERDLAGIFLPLGFSVSSLYGAAGIESGDAETLAAGSIVVATPEKLDFALRNDASLIDDVGLIVLDEGHMLGPNEREVRYEALVQRLLKRPDAKSRRVVCLSALFPTPEEMSDLVAWIRQDEPGNPVHAKWRPTRQRFGVLKWFDGAARLDVKVEEESPYVPRFVEPKVPPAGSRRRKSFPADKNELTLATAWKFIEQGKEVLIYCALRKSVETLGRLLLKCLEHGVLTPLCQPNQRIRDAMSVGAEWLGSDHPAVQCLEFGVALHHGGLPRPFLNEVEGLLRSGDCRLTVASPTLAQGLNISASVLLVPSIWRNQAVIPVAEFANVAGRAGRAFVDVEGLVLHVVWEQESTRWRTEKATERAVHNWEVLVSNAKAPAVKSGILLLAAILFDRIAVASGLPVDEVVDYVTGQSEAWSFSETMENLPVNETGDVEAGVVDQLLGAIRPKLVKVNQWDAYVASLDAALLALLESDTEASAVADSVEGVLQGSLFSRQLAHQEAELQVHLKRFIQARATLVWSQTTPVQRKGYHFAGVGLTAGQFLDAHLTPLFDLLLSAEAAVLESNGAALAEAAIEFARLVFQIAPFRPTQNLPDTWDDALTEWVCGKKASEVIATGGEDGVDLLQDAFSYRLPWAMEAVRVHASAAGHEWSEILVGLGAIAVEAGSANRSVIVLSRAGLASREAALTAVTETTATFDDHAGMKAWLASDVVHELSKMANWPTKDSRHAWLQFVEAEQSIGRKKWQMVSQKISADWDDSVPTVGASVVVQPNGGADGGIILTPDLYRLGTYGGQLKKDRKYVVAALVTNEGRSLEIEYFGPTK
jgi:hypothetical protein